MKYLILVVALFEVNSLSAQVFCGKGDQKFNIGAELQSGSTGIQATYDYGFGQNISFGATIGYALGIESDIDAEFDNRIHLRARFNANIGNVINLDPNFDIYPGIGLSTKSFGGHLGMRYFFSEGFGLYSEMEVPLASYKTDNLTPAEELYNQFTISAGMSFNF